MSIDIRDAVRGCLTGGAAGDALGYPVEFMQENEIYGRYGEKGIQEYEKDAFTHRALISDDTQMTLFTANCALYARARGGVPGTYMKRFYTEWYFTQMCPFEERAEDRQKYASWLMNVPELYSRRAPGSTCLYALGDILAGRTVHNNSKGCGGVMRVAPLGLAFPERGPAFAAEQGAELCRVTHQHPLGYMTGAMLADLVHRAVFMRGGKSLYDIALGSRNAIAEMYADEMYTGELLDIIDRAMELSRNDAADICNIHLLGEGWVAEEALAIALYCALRHSDDFSAAITAAVNHRGDSDSTGAITGNILGAWLGAEAIDGRWKTDLELLPVIEKLADDMADADDLHTEYGDI